MKHHQYDVLSCRQLPKKQMWPTPQLCLIVSACVVHELYSDARRTDRYAGCGMLVGRQGGGGVWLNPWHLTLKFENSLGGDAKMPARLALLAGTLSAPERQ